MKGSQNNVEKIYKALSVAGSDASGEAGMEADLKTFEEFGVYGMTALTVIVSCDPKNNWNHVIYPLPLDIIEKQLVTICEGVGCDAVKTGMLGSAELAALVADKIKKYKLRNVVIDPVLVCKGVDEIMVPDAAAAIKKELIPLADVVTPNSVEAAYFADMEKVETREEAKTAAQRIYELGAKNVVVKCGSRGQTEEYTDILYDGKEFFELHSQRIKGAFNMGAGCTFSSAIAANLAKGQTVKDAVAEAKKYITAALKESFPINDYVGSVKHWVKEK